jgi:alkylation response protein AidB-like acyl-CoA dehydrogenase
MSILESQHDLSAFRQAIRDWLARVVPPDWRSLVPGLFRAELGVGPGVVAVPGGAGWRSLHDQRTEDLVSNSMYADHCLLLTRTDPNAQKHRGITYFIMDMRSPGVEVRPIRQANGRAEFGELFLTDVRIPAENMIGAENNGWRVAQATLASERGVISFEGGERQRYEIEAFYRKSLKDGAAWLRDAQLHREFISFIAEMQAARRLLRRVLEESERQGASASVLPSIVKLSSTVLRQRICSFMVRIGGVDGQAFAMLAEEPFGSPMFEFMSAFSGTIAGGTNEIQRNIVAERGLGMPRV